MLKKVSSWAHEKYENWRWSQYFKSHAWVQSRTPAVEGLHRYEDFPILAASHFSNVRIVVDSEQARQQMLLALRYIHDMQELDTGYVAVNYLAHLYAQPDLVEVSGLTDAQLYPGYFVASVPTERVNDETADWLRQLEPFCWHWFYDNPQGRCRFFFKDHKDFVDFRNYFNAPTPAA